MQFKTRHNYIIAFHSASNWGMHKGEGRKWETSSKHHNHYNIGEGTKIQSDFADSIITRLISSYTVSPYLCQALEHKISQLLRSWGQGREGRTQVRQPRGVLVTGSIDSSRHSKQQSKPRDHPGILSGAAEDRVRELEVHNAPWRIPSREQLLKITHWTPAQEGEPSAGLKTSPPTPAPESG